MAQVALAEELLPGRGPRGRGSRVAGPGLIGLAAGHTTDSFVSFKANDGEVKQAVQ